MCVYVCICVYVCVCMYVCVCVCVCVILHLYPCIQMCRIRSYMLLCAQESMFECVSVGGHYHGNLGGH